jgi:DNA ligase D-like protein (predicted 3'-phosphoesterase)
MYDAASMSEEGSGMKPGQYRNEHESGRTTEPEGAGKSSGGSIYVIQKHDSKKLHWDLRLQMGSVLRSWAVPKEPPTEPGVKRLALPTRDHSLEYADFEGEIPKGHYGAGTVKIWDRGTFEPVEVDDKKGKIIFRMDGQRLSGVYCLIRTKTRGDKEQWLFFRKKVD